MGQAHGPMTVVMGYTLPAVTTPYNLHTSPSTAANPSLTAPERTTSPLMTMNMFTLPMSMDAIALTAQRHYLHTGAVDCL